MDVYWWEENWKLFSCLDNADNADNADIGMFETELTM